MTTSPGDVGEHRTAHAGGQLCAEPGDTLIIGEDNADDSHRIGMIVAVIGVDGAPPYLVRWLAGDFESTISPGAGTHVRQGH